jgi:cardiolipin synthase (CMP-forming)
MQTTLLKFLLHSLPNILTFFRLLATPFILFLILQNAYLSAFGVFTFAGISDWLDGYLARRWQVESTFGRLFDPVADKALMIVCFASLGFSGALPLWLIVITIGRDLLILIAALFSFFKKLKIRFEPIFISKLNTFFQILLIGTTLLFFAILTNPSYWQTVPMFLYFLEKLYIGLIVGSAITTLWSGWKYGVYFIRQLNEQSS